MAIPASLTLIKPGILTPRASNIHTSIQGPSPFYLGCFGMSTNPGPVPLGHLAVNLPWKLRPAERQTLPWYVAPAFPGFPYAPRKFTFAHAPRRAADQSSQHSLAWHEWQVHTDDDQRPTVTLPQLCSSYYRSSSSSSSSSSSRIQHLYIILSLNTLHTTRILAMQYSTSTK